MTGTHTLGALAIAGVALAGTAYGVGRLSAAPAPSSSSLGSQAQYTPAGMTPAATTNVATQGVVVACGAGERALVRPGVVGGAAVSQVECVAEGIAAPAAQLAATAPAAAPQAWAEPVAYGTPAVYRPSSTPSYRTVRNSDIVEYQPARRVERRPTRSWQKSAVIIGSSAGVGAGVGAAVGGKKGALIGAAIGGGGAAIWDQVTRRK
jgi:hypothetical protein